MWLKQTPIPTDFVALLDEWAARFFEELDYVHEGNNATRFAAQMKTDLPQATFPVSSHVSIWALGRGVLERSEGRHWRKKG